MREEIEASYLRYIKIKSQGEATLENAHKLVRHAESNELRLYLMKSLFKGTSFHKTTIKRQNILFIAYAEMN